MNMFVLGLEIALLLGSVGGLFSLLLMPFLAVSLSRKDRKIKELEGRTMHLTIVQESNRGKISDLFGKFNKLHTQVDEIESDLQRSNTSSIVGTAGKTKLKQPNAQALKLIRGEIKSLKKANAAIDKANKSRVVLPLDKKSNSKQGGKRANKSRNR